MRYFLKEDFTLRLLETPCLYNTKKDELYELDREGFRFLKSCLLKGGITDDRKFIDYCLKEGILSESKPPQRNITIRQSPRPSLRYLELQITDRCNLRCRHCYIGNPRGTELGYEKILQILDEFEALQGLRVLITGGEPLLHREFQKINSALPRYPLRKVLFTNGTLLNKKILKTLNVDEIQISIDGIEKSHDLIRGEGTYKKALKSVEDALSLGFEVSISTMVHKGNLKDFKKMESLFKRLGVRDWIVDIPSMAGRLLGNEWLNTPYQIAGRYLSYGWGGTLHLGTEGYGCGLHLMAISPEGKCMKCSFYSESPVGHIDEGLRRCWRRVKPIKIDRLDCKKENCPALKICRGGCRFRAESPLGKDLYKCSYYDRILNERG